MKRVTDFLSANPVFYFATIDGYKPRVRPLGFCMELNGKLYFALDKHKNCYKQLLDNPNIELCTASSDGQWIRVRGVAEFDNTKASRDAVLAEDEKRHGIDAKTLESTLGLVYIKYAEAEIADMDGNFEKLEI